MIKRPAFLLVLVIASALFSCKSEKNRDIFDDFEGEEGIYMIKLPPGLFLGMLESEAEVGEAELGNIDFVKLMIFDSEKAVEKDVGDVAGEIRKKFDKYGYEIAVQFSSGGTDISAYLLDNGEYVSDLMILLTESTGLFGLGISGNLDGKGIMKFASEVDYNELKKLKDFDIGF